MTSFGPDWVAGVVYVVNNVTSRGQNVGIVWFLAGKLDLAVPEGGKIGTSRGDPDVHPAFYRRRARVSD